MKVSPLVEPPSRLPFWHRWCCCSLAVAASMAAAASAEVVRLPAVMPATDVLPTPSYTAKGLDLAMRPEQHFDPTVRELDFTLPPPGVPLGQPEPVMVPPPWKTPPDARSGMFQKLHFDATWLASWGGNDFGVTTLETSVLLGIPIPSRSAPILATPGFAVHFFDGPRDLDVPPRLYDSYVQFIWRYLLTERLGMILGVTPGFYSDHVQGGDDALRISGLGVGMWSVTPTTKLMAGVAYLDRDDLKVLPAGGIFWEPHPDFVVELAVPRPKIARRVYWFGEWSEEKQDWLYVAGELGGGTWAVRRIDDEGDLLTYRDFRVALGLERRVLWGLDSHAEVGYVFGRKLSYARGGEQLRSAGTVMLRAGLVF